ncbi:MAG: tripartite tricarboxylate transporter substrate binding protein [Alphaproteobacteria bacterium]|nr:MAG: tripartite tricarboxylate transporter substrate binding protein [Alphaproteobacteria bacterium]
MFTRSNAILITTLVASSATFAQGYPDRPIRLVVPFAAGSATDYVARTVSNAASPLLGQSIVVENKVGANGVIAGADVATKKPDGYNLFMAVSSPISIAPALQKTMPYNPIKDFSYITNLAHYSFMLYVNKATPVNSYKEYIDYVKARPGKLNYGTGNMSNIAFNSQMRGQYSLDMLAVPYKSESDALLALMSGDIQSVWATVSVGSEHVKSGKLRALVTSASQRSPMLPDVPTFEEIGAKPLTVGGWATLSGPAGLAPDVVTKLNDAFTKALKQPDVVEKLARGGFVAAPSTPAQTLQFVQQQTTEYMQILSAAGVKPE